MNVIKIASEEVCLDPANLAFNETTLTEYLQKEGGYYNNFGAYLAKAEFILQRREIEYDALYGDKFKMFKDDGASDKKAEAQANSDVDIIKAKEAIAAAKYKVKLLQQHLRAWDKNHENAQSLGHYLRKEMDKLNAEIFGSTHRTDRFNSAFDVDEVDSKISHVNPDGTV